MNECLRRLWLSPVATEPNERIRRDFWKQRDVEDLPYHRGETVALVLDEEIRRLSGGDKSLDDFFRELLDDARRGEKAETSRLLDRISRWTSPAFAESLRNTVTDGALPDPPARISDPRAERADRDSYLYDPGFDVEASLKSKIVTGVRDQSGAFMAGLRDNQPIAGLSILKGDPDREISITILENNQKRLITFFPRGAPVRIPSYRLSLRVGTDAGTQPAC
jgi:predicted metalloprotease with PDZ domain